MNKDNAKDFLPLVEALASGKTIQIKDSDGVDWFDMTDVMFSRIVSDYRIKPELKKGWYRVALFKCEEGYWTETVDHDGCETEKSEERSRFFIKWLDERVEFELPEEEV